MRALFINLDRAAERRRFMERQGERLGLALERVRAVEAGEIDAAVSLRLNGRWERPLSDGELGCFLSHHAIWREVADGKGPVLVLEDDAVLSRCLPEALPRLASFAPGEFLNLETFGRRRFAATGAVDLGGGVSVRRVLRDKSGSAAYLLRPAGARKLLARAERRGAAPVDAFLHGLRELSSFQAEPALAIQAHLWEARGRSAGIDPATSIQTPRARLPLDAAHWRFHARRALAQVALLRFHALRATGRARYEPTPMRDEDFER